MSSGYVYVLSNKAMPNLIKIGHTTRTSGIRIEELFTTGVPTKFDIEIEIFTEDAPLLEKKLHSVFRVYRFRSDREFFKCEVEFAVKKIKNYLVDSTICVHHFSGRASTLYLTESELNKINEDIKRKQQLALDKQNYEKKRKLELDSKVNFYKTSFFECLTKVEFDYKFNKDKYEQSSKFKKLQKVDKIHDVGSALLALTGIFAFVPLVTSRLIPDSESLIANLYSPEQKDNIKKLLSYEAYIYESTAKDPLFLDKSAVWHLIELFEQTKVSFCYTIQIERVLDPKDYSKVLNVCVGCDKSLMFKKVLTYLKL